MPELCCDANYGKFADNFSRQFSDKQTMEMITDYKVSLERVKCHSRGILVSENGLVGTMWLLLCVTIHVYSLI